MMKCYDFVSQHAVNLFLEPFTECPHSVRIRTDTTLDQNCVLKATVQVRTARMIVSLLATGMNFKTQEREIHGTSTIDWDTIPWVRSSSLHDDALKLSTASLRLLRFGTLSRRRNCWVTTTCSVLERQN